MTDEQRGNDDEWDVIRGTAIDPNMIDGDESPAVPESTTTMRTSDEKGYRKQHQMLPRATRRPKACMIGRVGPGSVSNVKNYGVNVCVQCVRAFVYMRACDAVSAAVRAANESFRE